MGSQEYLDRARLAIGESAEFVAVGAWYGRPALVALLAARVRAALGEAAARGAARPRVIFTAHSLPERIRATGDTYPDQLAESARLVAEQAGLSEWEGAWQSAPARAPKRSDKIPPDAPPTELYETFPEVYVPPFHFKHPVTGADIVVPPPGVHP